MATLALPPPGPPKWHVPTLLNSSPPTRKATSSYIVHSRVHEERMKSKTVSPPGSIFSISLQVHRRCLVLFILLILVPRHSAFIVPRKGLSMDTSNKQDSPRLHLNSHRSKKDDVTIPDDNTSDRHHHQPNTIPVWQFSVESGEWERPTAVTPLVAHRTWAWCQNFVLPLQLCPWARTSLETPNALQIFLSDLNPNDNVVSEVGRRFQQFLTNFPQLESAAIFFIVFPNGDFVDFYNWFDEMEESWELMDDVIVAPFHPDWVFAGEPESLQFEKRSPYPTVTLVSTRVVDKAGEEATKQIGMQNEKTLLSKSPDELRNMWEKCLNLPATEIQ